MKKFIKVSLIITIPILLLVGFFKLNLEGINNNANQEPEEKIAISYKGYKEEINSHVILVNIKNNSKNIATLSDLELYFDYNAIDDELNGWDYGQNDIYFKGIEENYFDDNRKNGIDSGESLEVSFRIPKSINLDESKFDVNHPVVSYNASFYKFRTGQTSLVIGTCSEGGTKTLNMNY